MPSTPPGRTPNAGIPYLGYLQRFWHVLLQSQATMLDGVNAIGGLAVTPTVVASDAITPSGLGVTVAPGTFKALAGGTVHFAGDTATLTALTTTYLWLSNVPVLTTGIGWPAGEHVRLAIVTTNATDITTIVDQRVVFASSNGP